jgi:hypothetical protein
MTHKQIQQRSRIRGRGIDLAARSVKRRDDDPPQFAAGRRHLCGSVSMLRVITDRQGDSYRLDLHGLLGGEWVPLLEQHWRTLIRALPSAKVTLVLSNVNFIDPLGEQLLQRMADEGVDFVVAGCMNRYVIDHLKQRVRAAKGVRRCDIQ